MDVERLTRFGERAEDRIETADFLQGLPPYREVAPGNVLGDFVSE